MSVQSSVLNPSLLKLSYEGGGGELEQNLGDRQGKEKTKKKN